MIIAYECKRNSIKNLGFENRAFDQIDAQIIDALADNARVSIADIARKLKLSSPTITERMKRMEEADIIEGYAVALNYQALGLAIKAWIRIRPVPGELRRVAEIITSLPQIVQCDRITGDDCFIACAHVKTQSELEALIDKLMPYAMTNTSIVQSSPVPKRALPVRPQK